MPLIGKHIDQRGCKSRSDKGNNRQQKYRSRAGRGIKGNHQHYHQARSGVDAENAGISQIVAEDTLHHGAGNGQPRPNQQRDNDARQPEVEQN
ncbi:hypothetical protein D3C75_1026260 [compost metagenome]